MSTILNNNILPLWTWILIIVVGSLVVIGTLAFLIRCLVIRKRESDFVDTFGDKDLPARRVTVRRGRVVAQSKYLSLTGSRFGLNAFSAEDIEQSFGADRRSKSPFGWWSSMKTRSSSQQSQYTAGTERSSIYIASRHSLRQVYLQPESQNSTTTIESSMNDEKIVTTVVEVKPESPARKPPNFSRSLSRQGHRMISPRGVNTLSRIEESSPHTSMISTAQSRATSYMSKRDTTSTMEPPVSAALSSPQFPLPPRWNNRESISTNESVYHSAPGTPANTIQTQPLEAPRPVAYNSTRTSLGEIETSRRISANSHRASSASDSTPPKPEPEITALPEAVAAPDAEQHWNTRPDLHPLRTSSKKGKVLRKKSFRKTEALSEADS